LDYGNLLINPHPALTSSDVQICVARSNTRSSLWLQALRPRYPRLERDLEVDVAVVGAGITDLTTAWLLQREGVRVGARPAPPPRT
jgi:hypothetical protein